MIEGISHITLIVRDLEKATFFFKEIFDADEIYSSEEKIFSLTQEKFFSVNGIWIAVMKGAPLSERTYNHIAFKISDRDFEAYVSKIQKIGVSIKPERSRVDGEGRSLYFYDYDNHLFELHTGTLQQRLLRYNES